jgi:formate-dependent nitrite reductase membrane component NrfD
MTDYTPQQEWIDRQGMLLWLAFFFTEAGAGLYLVSLFFKFWEGCISGWLISGILGGGLHMLYLGRPERAWRAMLRPVKSELSRGLIIMALFLLFGIIQIAPSIPLLRGLPWASDSLLLTVVLIFLSFLVIVHGFMTMNVMSSILFWNSAILPVLSLASGIWIGSQLTLFFGVSFSAREILISLEPVARWSLFSYAFLVIFFLWNAGHASSPVQASLRVLVKGELSLLFYFGVVVVGLVIPIAITILALAGDGNPALSLLMVRVICAVLGDMILRYVITKSGRYSPLIYSNIVKG